MAPPFTHFFLQRLHRNDSSSYGLNAASRIHIAQHISKLSMLPQANRKQRGHHLGFQPNIPPGSRINPHTIPRLSLTHVCLTISAPAPRSSPPLTSIPLANCRRFSVPGFPRRATFELPKSDIHDPLPRPQQSTHDQTHPTRHRRIPCESPPAGRSLLHTRLVQWIVLTRVTQSTRPFPRRIPSKPQPPQKCHISRHNRALLRVRESLDPPRVFGLIPNSEHAHLIDKKLDLIQF
jgi:hypothetical protein